MTSIQDRIIKPNLGLAKQFGCVSKTCNEMGFSLYSFNCFKNLYENGGEQVVMHIATAAQQWQNRNGAVTTYQWHSIWDWTTDIDYQDLEIIMSKIVNFADRNWRDQRIRQLNLLKNSESIGHWQAVAARTMLSALKENPHRYIFDELYQNLMQNGDIKCAMQVLHLSGQMGNGAQIDFKLTHPLKIDE